MPRTVVALREPEDEDLVFNPAQWAKDHETLDTERFKNVGDKLSTIFAILGVAGTVMLSVLGWSLKAQYDGMAAQAEQSAAQLRAIGDVKRSLPLP